MVVQAQETVVVVRAGGLDVLTMFADPSVEVVSDWD